MFEKRESELAKQLFNLCEFCYLQFTLHFADML